MPTIQVYLCQAVDSTNLQQSPQQALCFYVSSNYGVTWTSGVTTGSWGRSCISSTGQYQYVTSLTGTGGVYYSNNYGASFTQVIPLASKTWSGICCSASGQYVSVGSSASVIYYSTNYGISYTAATSVSGYFISLASSASGQYQVGTEYGGNYVYYSDNYGALWTLSNAPFSTGWYGCASSASGQYMMACSANTGGVIYFSTNYGVSWFASGAPSIDYRSIAMSQNGLYTIAVNNRVGGGATGAVYLSTLANIGLVTNGRIGIGVTNPVCPLIIRSGNISLLSAHRGHIHIQDTSEISRFTAGYDTSYAYVQSWNVTPLILNALGNNVGIGTTTAGSALHVCGATAGASPLFLQNTSGSGNTWGVGPNNAGQFVIALNGTGVYVAPGGQSWAAGSDIRLKDDITSLSNCLQNITNLRPVSYRLKNYQNTSFKKLGFIAQEVQPILPELVVENGMDGMLGLLYTEFTPVIIGAIQELSTENTQLKSAITAQASAMALLEARLTAAGL